MLIQVQFSSGTGASRYTYNAPLNVVVGDRVKVPVERTFGGGSTVPDAAFATVVSTGVSAGEYAGDIKAIIGVVPPVADVVVSVNPAKLREQRETLNVWSPLSARSTIVKSELVALLDDMIEQADHSLGA